ncbi:MAG: lysophospholipid acyltransferase family protein [Candidatus Pacebacteria bacterium]|nr:lysophospholipid acyltransferase family protein [Candidatus Paceibacterota bacterium]
MKIIKKIMLNPLVALVVMVVVVAIRILPLRLASGLGGWIGRSLGPRFPVTELARQNLRSVLPNLSDQQIEVLVRQIWDNLGRTAFELPHLHQVISKRVTVIGKELVMPLIEQGQNVIFVGGHLGNWEIHGPTLSLHFGRVNLAYRALNNPILDGLLGWHRNRLVWRMIPKGASGMRKMITSLAEGESLGILFDQKLNNGIAVPFMGRMAMTTPAPALFALRFGLPLVVTTVKRLPGVRFEIEFRTPIAVKASKDKTTADQQQMEIMTRLNNDLGQWIMDNPQHWLWLHRRWPKGE